MERVFAGEEVAASCPQILFELYAVLTRAFKGSRPLTPETALNDIRKFEKAVLAGRLEWIEPTPSTWKRCLDLLGRTHAKGAQVFDVFLVATMLDHGLTRLFTENVKDFQAFHELQVTNPLIH